ncbi:MAG: Maf family protein, partial [Oscillospiraceae bacterium]
MNIVLASASPRRRELLMMLGMPNLTIIPAVGEEVITEGMKPDAAVCALSRQKAEEVSKLCKLDDLIIAADTIVFTGGEILGKPLDEKDAARMLKRLSNRSHLVYTGVTIMRGDTIITQCE